MGFDERALYRMYLDQMAEAERKRLEALAQQGDDATTDTSTTTDTTTTDTTSTDTTTDDETTTFDPQDLNQDGEISDQEAAVNLGVWETLQQDLENAERAGVDTGLSTIGILGSIFGADFDVGSLDSDLVNILLGVFDKNYDDFQEDLKVVEDNTNTTDDNNTTDPNTNTNTTDPNTNTNTTDNQGNGMSQQENDFLRSILDGLVAGDNPFDRSGDIAEIISKILLGEADATDLIQLILGDTTQTTGDTTQNQNVDQTTNVQGGDQTTNVQGGDQTTAVDTTVTSQGGAGGAGGAGGQGGIGQGGAGGIGQGGSVSGVTTGSQSIGDTILDTVTNIIENPVDVVGAALIEEAIRRYEADQLKDASDAELALLRELMGTREDVYAPFYSLGGTAPGPDGVFNTADDVSFLDATLDDYRTAATEPFEPRIDLMDERGVGELVDVQPNRFDIAQMVSEIGRGAVPDAMFTQVNQINPFNPDDPGLRFLQDEGRRAIEASAAAQGRLNTGGTLQELQNQAIGTAAQYAGNLADIGRTQDTSRLGRDQQFYNQLFGTQEQRFGQDLEQLAGIQSAQDAQDRMQLEADAARFESGQQLGQQVFDQAATVADQDFRRNQLPMDNLANLIELANRGATGLTGGETGYLGAGYSSSANSPYSFLADNSIRDAVNRENVYGRVLGNRFTNLFR